MYIEYKPGEKHALKGADTSSKHESFRDCGYLLEETDLVIDIDNLSKDTIKKMITYFDIKTQIVWGDRGAHLYFIKPKGFKAPKEAICPLGFKVENLTKKNRPNGVTIKRDGVLRTIENKGVREELPDFLYLRKEFKDLYGMDSGRNNAMYSHKCKLIHSLKNYMKSLKFINEYIFAEPLDEKEFETVARYEDKIEAVKHGESKVAEDLIRKLKVVKYCNVLYLYDGIRYKADDDFITIIKREIPDQHTRYVDEVAKQMRYGLFNKKEKETGWDIKFPNGILRNGKFIELDSSEFTPHYIDIPYIEDAEPVQIVDDFLDLITKGNEDYKKLITEIMGHCLITNVNFKKNKNFQKVFFFIGSGGNGKSSLMAVLRKITGQGNYSTAKLEQLKDERYKYDLKGKLLNVGEDIENTPVSNGTMTDLKNLSAYDEILLRKLFAQPVSTTVSATLIFTTNHLLKSFEKGEAWKRRAVWLPNDAKPKYNPHFMEEIMSPKALEYWVKLMVEGYFRLYKNGDFTTCKVVDDYTSSYHEENNSCLTFVRDYDSDYYIGKRPPEVYGEYEVWAEENGRNVQSKKILKDTIQSEHGLVVKPKKVNGKTADVYTVA